MLISIFSISLLLFSIIFYLCTNPISIGVITLLIAISSTLVIATLISSWLCFLVFLIYIRGILVLFSYFVAITPNLPMPSLIINISCLLLRPILLFIFLSYPTTLPINTQPELYISYIYSNNSSSILILLACVLLLTIIIVVKLISIKKGPLRPFIYV